MKLVFFIGHAGVGKTTISEALVKKTNAVYLDKDVIGKHYMDKLSEVMNIDPNDRDSDIYETEFRNMEYLAMLDIAAQNLSLGNDVYLVAPFTRETNNSDWLPFYLAQHGLSKEEVDVRVVMVYVENPELQKERFIKRNAPRDDWKLSHWKEYQHTLKRELDVKWDIPLKNVVRFNNHRPLNDEIIQALYEELEK